jgi:hypothetical protein
VLTVLVPYPYRQHENWTVCDNYRSLVLSVAGIAVGPKKQSPKQSLKHHMAAALLVPAAATRKRVLGQENPGTPTTMKSIAWTFNRKAAMMKP